MRRIAAVTAIAVAAALAVALVFDRLPTSNSSQPSGPLTAAIIDQASLTQPNPALAESATAILERAGYSVDYYPGEQVTVDFYRDLPTLGYDLLIVRTHSGLYLDGIRTDEAFLFTSEPYSQTEHLDDQRARRLIKASYYTEGLSVDLDPPDPPAGRISSWDVPYFFGIPVEFIRSSMRGSFDHATVILMGCNGLTTNALAKAFVDRGASDVMSWDGLVSARHTDAATEELLTLLLDSGLSVDEAVAQTMDAIGPDPEYGSVLRSYSSEE